MTDLLRNEFPKCEKEEITWQGDFGGKRIVMTAKHIIWLEHEPIQPGRECKHTELKCMVCDVELPVDKPQAEAGKCFCACHRMTSPYKGCGCKCWSDAKPADPVEGCIKDILWNYKNVAEEPQNIFEHYLHELVSLARSTPPRE